MAIQWFHRASAGRASGPVDSAELRRLAEAGIVRPDTLVRQGDSARWVRAKQVRGLFQPSTPAPSSTPATPPPPPPPPVPQSGALVNEESEKPERVWPVTWAAIIVGSGSVLLLLWALVFRGGSAPEQVAIPDGWEVVEPEPTRIPEGWEEFSPKAGDAAATDTRSPRPWENDPIVHSSPRQAEKDQPLAMPWTAWEKDRIVYSPPQQAEKDQPPLAATRSAKRSDAAPAAESKSVPASDPSADGVGRILSRALDHMKAREYDRAIADFTEAIRLDPKNAQAYYGRGLAYQAKGQRAVAAKRDFAQAKRLGYKAPPTRVPPVPPKRNPVGESPTPIRRVYAGTGEGHWISKNIGSGEFIVLEDGSLWEIDRLDRIDAFLWLSISNITVVESNRGSPGYDYLLINTDDGEKAHAKYMGKR